MADTGELFGIEYKQDTENDLQPSCAEVKLEEEEDMIELELDVSAQDELALLIDREDSCMVEQEIPTPLVTQSEIINVDSTDECYPDAEPSAVPLTTSASITTTSMQCIKHCPRLQTQLPLSASTKDTRNQWIQ